MQRLIDADVLITSLWEALFKYEDSREKQFQESEELDVADWFSHRSFVQDMSDIDRDTVIKQPTVDAVPIRCKDCKYCYAEGFVTVRNVCEKHYDFGNVDDDWFCADGERREEP